MKIDSVVTLETAGKDPAKVKALLKECTYANPAWSIARNLGFSVWSIPRTISTYEREGTVIRFSRGEISKVRGFFPEEPLDEMDNAPRAAFTYTNKVFDLDSHQKEAVRAITRKKQGIIFATTSAGKTHIVIASAAALGYSTLILVHRKILLKQFRDDIQKYVTTPEGLPIDIGIIGDGSLTVGKEITIAMEKTLSKHPELYDKFGVVFMDECHLAPANTFQLIMNKIPAARRYGLSGTLVRKDQKQFLIYATFGKIISQINKEDLLDLNRISPVRLEVHESDVVARLEDLVESTQSTTKAWAAARKILHESDERLEQIVRIRQGLGGKALILSGLVDPCRVLASKFEAARQTVGVITGRDSKEAQKSFEDIKAGTIDTVVATVGCVSTGVDIPDLDHIILMDPIFSNEVLLGQIIGRVRRKAAGKIEGVFHFIWDPGVFSKKRLNQFYRTVSKFI